VSLQTGVAPLQRTLSVLVHCTHVPAAAPAVTHAGAVASEQACAVPERRSPSHATQVPALQIGVVPEHAASVMQATHVFVVTLHVGVAPPHWVSSRHWTQLLVAALHLGVSPEQLASVAQPAVHVFVATLQIPFTPLHSAFDLHWTQR
jgi:hypothetical protein